MSSDLRGATAIRTSGLAGHEAKNTLSSASTLIPGLNHPAAASTTRVDRTGTGGFNLPHIPPTPSGEDIESELAATLVVHCEIGLGGGL